MESDGSEETASPLEILSLLVAVDVSDGDSDTQSTQVVEPGHPTMVTLTDAALSASSAYLFILLAASSLQAIEVTTQVDENGTNPINCSLREAVKTLNVKQNPEKNYRELQKATAKLFKNYPPGLEKK